MRFSIQKINIPRIILKWHNWVPFNKLKEDARKEGIKIPNRMPGVYEAKYAKEEKRLTIGKTSNLRFRIRQGLVKGKAPHSTGDKIRANEDLSKVVVRWAVTKRPSAAEEELHRKYVNKFKRFPKYTDHT